MLAEENVNTVVIQNLMRHRDPKMTELYLQRAKKDVVVDMSELLAQIGAGGKEGAKNGCQEKEKAAENGG